jgi:uncharacterized protein
MVWLYYFLLLIVLLIGLGITVLGLPGLWVMLLAVIIYAWITHWIYVAGTSLIAISILCVLAETVELFAGAAAAKKAGAGKRAMIFASIGAIVGGILFSFIPIPILAQIVGACVGAGAGALIAELSSGTTAGASFRIGVGAAKGRLIGTILKLIFGMVILITSLIAALPVGKKPALKMPPPVAPASLPTTSPG